MSFPTSNFASAVRNSAWFVVQMATDLEAQNFENYLVQTEGLTVLLLTQIKLRQLQRAMAPVVLIGPDNKDVPPVALSGRVDSTTLAALFAVWREYTIGSIGGQSAEHVTQVLRAIGNDWSRRTLSAATWYALLVTMGATVPDPDRGDKAWDFVPDPSGRREREAGGWGPWMVRVDLPSPVILPQWGAPLPVPVNRQRPFLRVSKIEENQRDLVAAAGCSCVREMTQTRQVGYWGHNPMLDAPLHGK